MGSRFDEMDRAGLGAVWAGWGRMDRQQAGTGVGAGLAGEQECEPFGKLKGQELSKKTADRNARIEVALPADGCFRALVVATLGMIERELHKAGEPDPAPVFNLGGDDLSDSIHWLAVPNRSC